MPKKIFYIFFFVYLKTMAFGQEKVYNWNVSAGINIPVWNFSETHFSGISLLGEYSRGRFGKLKTIPQKQFGYFISSGSDFYFGKKEIVSGYPFRYSGYFILHNQAGVIWNTGKECNVRLGAGPAISNYKKNFRFNISSTLTGSWYISKNTGIAAGLQMMQETGAFPLWTVFARFHKAY